MDRQQDRPVLREYFAVIYRRKVTVLAVFAITTGAAAAAAWLSTPVFTARTALIVKFGREFIYRPEVGDMEGSRTFSLDEMVNAQAEILRSRDLAREVIEHEELGAGRLYPEVVEEEPDPDKALAKAIAVFQDHVSINPVFDSSIIRIAFQHRDPETAAAALNVLVEKFKEKHLEIFSESKSGFLREQVRKHRQNLDDAEAALESFRRENGIYELTAQKEANITQRVELEAELRQALFRIAELEQQLKSLESDTGDAFPAVPNPAFPQQRAALISRRAELTSALQDAEARIAELTQSLTRFTERDGDAKETVPPQPGVERFRSLDDAHAKLLELELKYLELRPMYNRDSRQITAVKNEILRVKQFLRDRGTYVKEVLEAAVRDELSSLHARRRTLTEQISAIESELRSLADLERSLRVRALSAELAALRFKKDNATAGIAGLDEEIPALATKEKVLRELERQVTLAEKSFQTYVEKLEEAQTTEELDERKIVNVRVIETAAPPVSPTGLSKKLKIALGAFVGMLAGVAAAFFLELLTP